MSDVEDGPELISGDIRAEATRDAVMLVVEGRDRELRIHLTPENAVGLAMEIIMAADYVSENA